VRAYAKDPEYLVSVLDAKGDPNTRRTDNDPILMAFVGTGKMDAIRLLARHGADLNAKSKDGFPLVLDMALSQDWDAVWTLLQLGAEYRLNGQHYTWEQLFSSSRGVVLPGSTVYPEMKKAWQFLTSHGIPLSPLGS